MSNLEYGLEGLKLAAALSLLFVGFRVMRAGVLANWRQNLFAIRNELWDRMRAEGCLDAKAHRTLRSGINGFIRIGPALNLVTLLAIVGLAWRISRSGVLGVEKASPADDGLTTDAARQAVRRAESDMLRAVLYRVAFDTIPGALLGWPAWLIYRGVRVFTGARALADRQANQLKMLGQRWASTVGQAAGTAEAAC